MEENYVPGLLIDARGHLAFAVLADSSVGVSVERFDWIPHKAEEMTEHMATTTWVIVDRDNESMYMATPSGEYVYPQDLGSKGAEANEAAQFAIELALALWPDWCPNLRDVYKPRTIIPLPRQMPQA